MKNNSKKESRNNRLPVFYIALCCCVLAIGVAGYISESISVDETSSVADNVEIYTPKPVYTAAPIETLAPEIPVFNEEIPSMSVSAPVYEEEIEPVIEDYTFDNPDITAVNAESEVFEGIIMPVDGDILQPFTDTPCYNEVMGDWRTHNGIDIAAEEGREVVCAANGEVKSMVSTVYGTQITVSHSDGFESIYSQIEPSASLKEGGNVRCGDVIGTIAAPKGEPVKDSHLHFEVMHEGKYINPAEFISN